MATKQKKGIYEKYIKAPQDVFLAIIALLLTWPLILTVAILVRVKLGGPVIFKQERAGKNGKAFYMYKFRTMSDERAENCFPTRKDLEVLEKSYVVLRWTSFHRF